MTYALRTDGDPLRYVAAVRQIVHEADGRVPVTNLKTQAADIDQTINQEIVFARLCTAFAILALVIACVGLYATMAYAVARRTRTASGWRSEPGEAPSSGWCCARSACWLPSGWRSACRGARHVAARRIVSVRDEAERSSRGGVRPRRFSWARRSWPATDRPGRRPLGRYGKNAAEDGSVAGRCGTAAASETMSSSSAFAERMGNPVVESATTRLHSPIRL